MASTYSDRLRIELIGTGEQSGTWGNTTNTNLGTLIEEAIAGVASITMTDANYTLTVADGSTDESRQAVLVMSGTLSTTRNVICPAEEKVYIIKNSTTGGQSIVLKTSGGTGITVPNGATMLVFCDGTNVLSGQDAAASWSVSGNATVGGTLTVDGATSLDDSVVINESGADKDFRVEGDTDTNLLFTDASADAVGIGTNTPGAKLNIVANTSGDAVRITQTGAGNALVVEDSTNPDSTPFVIDTNGNVLIGTTTTRTISGQVPELLLERPAAARAALVRNTNDTGGPILLTAKSRGTTNGSYTSVSSGDALGTWNFAGSDGTADIQAAQIRADVDGTPGTNDMPGRLVFSTTADGASSPTERMRIDNAGQVGIGQAPAVGRNLVVAKNITGSVISRNITSIGQIQSDVTSQASYFATSASTASSSFTLGALHHFAAIQGAFNGSSIVTNQYGYFADATLVGSVNNYGFYGNIADAAGRWNFYANGTAPNYFGGNVTLGATTTYAAGSTFTSPKLQVTGSTGNDSALSLMQWGTSSFPVALFSRSRGAAPGTRTVVQSGDTLGRAQFFGDDGTNFVIAAEITASVDGTPGTNDMPGRLVFSTTADGASSPTERMRIDTSGNVQIGTTSSAGKLTVYDATNAQALVQGDSTTAIVSQRSSTDTTPPGLVLRKTRGTVASQTAVASNDQLGILYFQGYGGTNLRNLALIRAYVDTYTSDSDISSYLAFSTSSSGSASATEKMRINSSGNVGIGTSAPVNKLDVTGSFGRGAPVTKTGDFTLAATENWIICNGTGSITVTLPAASSWTGRELTIKTIAAQTVVSASSNVVPLAGGAAGTAILAATAGKFATLVSDGTNWVIMAAN